MKNNRRRQGLARVLVAALTLPGLASCVATEHHAGLQSLRYVYHCPAMFYEQDGSTRIYTIADTIYINFLDDMVLYRLPQAVDFGTGELIGGTQEYYLYREGRQKGFLFESIKQGAASTELPVDSFIRTRAVKGKDFDLPPDTIWRLVELRSDENSFIENYALIRQPNDRDFDSICFQYDKRLHFDYSFSKKLDSLRKMKLFRVRLVHNEKYSREKKLLLPKRSFLFEIQPAEPPEGKKALTEFMNRQKKIFE